MKKAVKNTQDSRFRILRSGFTLIRTLLRRNLVIIQHGFTLIELLVVISIIGILASLAVFSFTSSQKQAKDTQRKSDLRQYSTSLESFANLNSSLYPSHIATSNAAETLCADLVIGTSCPEDPKYTSGDTTHAQYAYQSDGSGPPASDATKYVLWAKLENITDYFVICSNGKVGPKSQTGFSVA